MKILVIIPSFGDGTQAPKYSGVDYHRLVQPHRRMSELFPELEISQINEIDSRDIDFLKQFDLVVANRFISKLGNNMRVIENLKFARTPYVLDLDDDYRIPVWHVLHKTSQDGQHAHKILQGVNGAAAVTCTHEYLSATIAAESRQKNFHLIPNGIYPEDQFEVQPYTGIPSFGWSGSVTHFEDVLELFPPILSLYHQPEINFKMVYGGYNGTDEVSKAIAGILSAKGKARPDQFATFPSCGVKDYARFYDYINVALIPLRHNRFNSMKSNLKLIEAGFKKKAAIVSDVYPYSPLLRHGKNCLVVKKKNDWYNHMVTLIKNPNMITDLAAQLHEDVQVQHIDVVAIQRYEAYKQIVCKKMISN